MAEGAIDRDGNPITAELVRKTVVEQLNQDTRITVLGRKFKFNENILEFRN